MIFRSITAYRVVQFPYPVRCRTGSADARAYETLRGVALSLLAAKRRLPEVALAAAAAAAGGGGAAAATSAGQVAGGGAAAVGRLDRAPVEAALDVVVLALAVVMAGTGGWGGRVGGTCGVTSRQAGPTYCQAKGHAGQSRQTTDVPIG